MGVFVFILTNNIIPIFTLIVLGYLLHKKFNLDIYSLSKLNFYIFVPAFTFVNLYITDIPLEVVKVFIGTIILLIINMVLGTVIARLRQYDKALENAFKNAIMFYNSGNIGIPVVTLVFSSPPFVIDGQTPYLTLALTAQIMVLVVQNITTNTLGFINAGNAAMHWKKSVLQVLKMPAIYAIPSAFLLKLVPYDMTQLPVWQALNYARNALVPVALLTLGVQLCRTTLSLTNKNVWGVVALRLIGGPIMAYALVRILGLEGVLAQVLLISAAVPTAVNTALIAVECDNRPDFASQVVMLSTLLSGATLVAVIYIARVLFSVT